MITLQQDAIHKVLAGHRGERSLPRDALTSLRGHLAVTCACRFFKSLRNIGLFSFKA